MARLGGLAQCVWSNGGLYRDQGSDAGSDDVSSRAVVLLRLPTGLKGRPVVEVCVVVQIVIVAKQHLTLTIALTR